MSTITVSTDGSALGNPNGAMGWAWADHVGGGCDAGGATNGTNQIGELCAVLQALRTHRGPDTLIIESDSQYAIKCSSVWLPGWKRNGWKNSQKQPVKNAPIIKAIDYEISHREGPVRFSWVKGHAGNEFNEKCDTLARGFAEQCKRHGSDGFLPIEGWDALIHSGYAQGLRIPDDVRAALEGGEAHTSLTISSTPHDTSYGNLKRSATNHAERPAGASAAPRLQAPQAPRAPRAQQPQQPRTSAADADIAPRGFDRPAAPARPLGATHHVVRVSRNDSLFSLTDPEASQTTPRQAAAPHAQQPMARTQGQPDAADLLAQAAQQLVTATERLDAATARYEQASRRLEELVRRMETVDRPARPSAPRALDDTTRNNGDQSALF